MNPQVGIMFCMENICLHQRMATQNLSIHKNTLPQAIVPYLEKPAPQRSSFQDFIVNLWHRRLRFIFPEEIYVGS